MQKKLIALAIAAAVAAPAVALADVTVYGKVKMSYDIVDSTNTVGGVSTTVDVNQVSANRASRIGFKGSEDLGGGLSAVWQIESGVNLDEQGGTWASRNSFLGLSSKDMGTVVLGNHDTPYKLATRGMDMFGDTLADNRSLMGGNITAAGTTVNHDARARNVIAYLTPNFNGFNGAIAYTTNALGAETNKESADVNGWSLMGSYSVAGFTGSLAYQTLGIDDTNGAAAAGELDTDAWKLGLSYSAAGFTGSFVYENVDMDDDTAGATPTQDADAWNLGLKYAFSSSDAIKFQYTDREYNSGVAGATDVESDQWSIGYDHDLSKNTKLFALYTDADGDVGATTTLYTAPNAGRETDGFSFGIEHNF